MTVESDAESRKQLNRYSKTNRPLVTEAEQLGIAGEIAFATRILGIENYRPPTTRRTPGYQFIVDGVWTIKVTTSRTPGNLFVKTDNVAAMIYILAGCHGEIVPENVFWLGWANERDVRAAEVIVPKRGGNYVIPSHAIKAEDLDTMGSLCQIIGAIGWEAKQLFDPQARRSRKVIETQDLRSGVSDDGTSGVQAPLFGDGRRTEP